MPVNKYVAGKGSRILGDSEFDEYGSAMSGQFVDLAVEGDLKKPPHAVLAMTLSKDAEALTGLEALDSSQVRLLAAEDTEQARRLIEHERPIAGLLQLGRRPDPQAVQKALALAEMAPRLRLIALWKPKRCAPRIRRAGQQRPAP